MKKTYLEPKTLVVKLEMTQIMAGSQNPQGFAGALADGEGETGNGEKALSRNYTIWDEEEEE